MKARAVRARWSEAGTGVSGDDVARLCIASHVTLGQRARESKPSETSEGEKAVRRRRAILSSDATAISLAVEGGQAEQTRSFSLDYTR